MLVFRMLGEAQLADADGRQFDALLRQPKHLALLAVLAMPRPGAWHRRDVLLGLFWPEQDQAKARSALRSALYTVRRHLPDGAIRTRGDDELSLDPEAVTTDVAALERSLEAGDSAAALAGYVGDLLPGFFVTDAPDFDRWLQGERDRVRRLASAAAARSADEHAMAGQLSAAVAAARRGAELAPTDETAARRWIMLLDRDGDRAGAFAAYEWLRNQLNESLGVRPSAETVALMDGIRTRRDSRFGEAELLPGVASRVEEPTPVAGTQVAPAADVRVSEPLPAAAPRRSRWMWPISGLAAVAVVSWAVFRPSPAEHDLRGHVRTLVIAPMVNETGSENLSYLAAGIAEGIGRRLDGVGGLELRSSARAPANDSLGPDDFRRIGTDLSRVAVLRSWLRLAGDTLVVRAALLNPAEGRLTEVATARFTVSGIGGAESRIAAALAGILFRRSLALREEAARIDPESYRLTLLGLDRLLGVRIDMGPAQEHFEAARQRDPNNARAWAGLSSVWLSKANADRIPAEEGFRLGESAARRALEIDPRQGSALANLGVVKALRDRDLSAGLRLVDSATMVEPSNGEIWLLKSVLLRHAHRWEESRDAIRIAQHLDPLSDTYQEREVVLHFCAGRPQDAVPILEAQLALRPRSVLALTGMQRALGLMGRYNDALVMWRRAAAASRDTALSRLLAEARGRLGYFAARHALGRRQLIDLERAAYRGRVPEMRSAFLAGDTLRGFAALDQLELERSPALFRFGCNGDNDEFREHPRVVATLQRVGPLR
ncbi:MAG: hypothetical protein IPK85_20005 [Gemmatimonadetes bacterium]|nr:hypothetical protein [Gemmatimonadota bacterium]